MTRAYRRRRYQTDREYDEGLSWDEEYSPRGYTGGNVDWGGGDAEAEYSVDDNYGVGDHHDAYHDGYDGYGSGSGYPDGQWEDGTASWEETDQYPERRERYSDSRYRRTDDRYYGRPRVDHAPPYEEPERVEFEPYFEPGVEYIPHVEGRKDDIYRRESADKRGYLEYSGQFRHTTQQDYLAPAAILPGQSFKTKIATSPKEELYMEYVAKDKWKDTAGRGSLSGIYRVLNIFYEPFILRSFGLKLPAIQLIATLALLELYNITFNMGDAFLVGMIEVSGGWIEHISPFLASIFGIVLGFVLSLYPALREEPKKVIKISLIAVILVILLFNPLLNLIFFSGWDGFLHSLMVMVIVLGKIVLVILYFSPVWIGVFAIWSRKYAEALLVVSGTLMLLAVVTSNVIDIHNNVTIEVGDLSLYFIYAIVFFIYMETGDSSMKYYRFAQEIPDDLENRDQIYFFNKTLNHYFLMLMVFVVLGTVSGLIIYYRTSFLGAMGSVSLAESMEVSTYFGMMIAMVVLFTLLGLLIIIVRRREVFLSPFKRILNYFAQQRLKQKEMIRIEEEVRRLKLLDQHL